MKNKLYVITGMCYPYEYDEDIEMIGEPIVKQTFEEAKNEFAKILEGIAEEANTEDESYTYSTFFSQDGMVMAVIADEMFRKVYEIFEVEVDF